MPFIPCPGILAVEMRYIWELEQCENTLYFQQVGAWDPSAMVVFGNQLKDWWSANLMPSQSVHSALSEVKLTDLTTADGAAVSVSGGLPFSGGVAGESMPNSCAGCISFHTAKRGRSFRGRNYLIGIPADSISGNEMTPGYMSAQVAAYTALFAVATEGACTWVVLSRFSGVEAVTHKPIPRAAGVAEPVLSASFTDNIIDNMRRRLPNH